MIVRGEDARGNDLTTDAVKTVAARDEVADDLDRVAVDRAADPRRVGLNIHWSHVLDPEIQGAVGGFRARIRSLTTSCCPYITVVQPVSSVKGRRCGVPSKFSWNPSCTQSFPIQPAGQPSLADQIDGPLFEQSSPNPLLDVFSTAALEHDRLDAVPSEQM